MKSFTEYYLEYEDNEEGHGFEKWEECREYVIENLYKDFRPFSISCIHYRADGRVREKWCIEWNDPSLKATTEDKKYFREVGAYLCLSLFRWAY